jgi:23S rRNA (uracil747-C5)-methyltransferase
MPDFCAYFTSNICRSCEHLPTGYAEQISNKEKLLKTALPGNVNLDPAVTSAEQGFRNKAKLIVSGTFENPVIGLIDREILDCPIHHPAINELIHDLIPFITEAKLDPYLISEKKGELKGLIIYHGDETYLRFVVRSREPLDRIKKHLPSLLQKHADLASVSVNIQPIHQAVLEGEVEILLGPRDSISQSYNGVSLRLRPRAFVQTNQKVAEKLYATAASWVKELEIEKFLELFCGQGAFSFHCAGFVKEARGVEINEEAVKMANESAHDLGLNHLKFMSMDARKALGVIKAFHPDLILVNPPRRGLAESVSVLTENSPQWIIYSSCDVSSLARDLKELSPQYEIKRARLFDMFPHTSHFESLVLLQRR